MEAVLKREFITNKAFCRVFGIIAFVMLTSLGAFVRIPLPFTPVPVTLQTFFVLLSAALLGRRLGIAAQLSYVFLGASGISVFTGTAVGAAYLLGPTGGYLLGFLIAAFIIGSAIRYVGESVLSVFVLFCVADLAILASGTLWLKSLLHLSTAQAVSLGFMPFVAGDILKVLAAVAVYSKLKERAGRIF